MERKEFLKSLGFAPFVLPLMASCSKDDDPASNGSCVTSPSETAGPFPTKDPSSLAINDIRSDRTGVETTVTITVQNRNNSCSPLEGVFVDIWHCDKDGYYSEYGGNALQPEDLSDLHFLRGRQTTDSNGQVIFTTIFPGWYPGRAPHIHVHIFDGTGKSLLVTQIAFPKPVCDTVYTTATQFYTKGIQDTSNEGDGVFANSLTRELAAIDGSIAEGYALTHTIVVNA